MKQPQQFEPWGNMLPRDQEQYLLLLAQMKKNLQKGIRILIIISILGLYSCYKAMVSNEVDVITIIYAIIPWILIFISKSQFKKLRLEREPIIQGLDEILAKYKLPKT